jgi:hypothetical protein
VHRPTYSGELSKRMVLSPGRPFGVKPEQNQNLLHSEGSELVPAAKTIGSNRRIRQT